MNTTTEPLQIKWKLLVPWLESQPKDRSFNYGDIRNCLICNFIAETHGLRVTAGADEISAESGKSLPIPQEIIDALFLCRVDLIKKGVHVDIWNMPITIGSVLARLKPPA